MIRWLRNLAGWLGRWFFRLSGEEVRYRVGRTGVLTAELSPLVTEVRLRIDRTEPRTLRFTLAESAAFRKRTGISVFTGKGTPGDEGLDIYALEEEQFLELLAVCCFADDPTVTPEQLAPHLHGQNLVDALAAVGTVVGDFHPDMTEDVLENPLLANALVHLMRRSTGRSPRRRSASPKSSSGASPPG
jgi:hypothetical protein